MLATPKCARFNNWHWNSPRSYSELKDSYNKKHREVSNTSKQKSLHSSQTFTHTSKHVIHFCVNEMNLFSAGRIKIALVDLYECTRVFPRWRATDRALTDGGRWNFKEYIILNTGSEDIYLELVHLIDWFGIREAVENVSGRFAVASCQDLLSSSFDGCFKQTISN